MINPNTLRTAIQALRDAEATLLIELMNEEQGDSGSLHVDLLRAQHNAISIAVRELEAEELKRLDVRNTY